MASIDAINISEGKGIVKRNIEKGYFKAGHGLLGDYHAGNSNRQVSLFAMESVDKLKASGLNGLCNKKFVENLTTKGIPLHKIHVGSKLKIGEVVLEISRIGKECYEGCKIKNTGECVMPLEVVFARVLKDGWIKPGDDIQVL